MYYYHVSKMKDLKTLKPSIPCNSFKITSKRIKQGIENTGI